MKLESLKSPKFEPLGKDEVNVTRGGEGYEYSSSAGKASINGKVTEYSSDCSRLMDYGKFRTTYTLPDGTGIIIER